MALSVLYRKAIERELVTENLAREVKSPMYALAMGKFLPLEFVWSTDLDKYTEQVCFIALQGLRWSQAKALTWADIHDGRVHSKRSMHGPTKTKAGIRSVHYLGHFSPITVTAIHLMTTSNPSR